MFSKQITTSDAFVDMPVSSQLLYFHLNMEADDDGFVGNPKRVMRMLNVSDDDMKILLAKRFLLSFENGVVVIKHWLLHNAIRKDMYQETQYLDEKKMLKVKDNKAYTEGNVQIRNESVTKPVHRLDQIRLEKIREEKEGDPDKPERHLSYLLEIPEEDLTELEKKYNVYREGIKGKAEDLHNYIQAKGKTHTYKNYKAFLMNALKKDFGLRKPEEVERLERLREHQKASTVSSPFARNLAEKMKLKR